jgi:hypothetical protein
MSHEHLTSDELDRLLSGDELTPVVVEHVHSCLVCRRRRDGFLAAVEAVRIPDPSATAREESRAHALINWTWGNAATSRRQWRWWALAAAAAMILAALPLLWSPSSPKIDVNADAVLVEVDSVLARDPLAAMAPEEVVEVVLPDAEPAVPSSTS